MRITICETEPAVKPLTTKQTSLEIRNVHYETYLKEGQHLKALLKLKLTKEGRIPKRDSLKHLLDGYIFYSISTWPSSIKEILEHDTITNKNTFKIILFAYGNGISPNVFIEYLYTFILNTPPKIKKRAHQLQWIITNINTHQHKWYCFSMCHWSLWSLEKLKSDKTHLTTKRNYGIE